MKQRNGSIEYENIFLGILFFTVKLRLYKLAWFFSYENFHLENSPTSSNSFKNKQINIVLFNLKVNVLIFAYTVNL
jgi:hypothetical protein